MRGDSHVWFCGRFGVKFPLPTRRGDFHVRFCERNGVKLPVPTRLSERFGISVRTLFRWKNQLEPKTRRNKPATKIDMEALKQHVEDYPDAYQYERAQALGVSPTCILYALRRLKISHKKNIFSSESR